MEVPLSPLEFMRRTRRLYPGREAVVDGSTRLTYEEFFERCDRWSSVLQGLGIGKGDRIAYISSNTLAMLESYYAVPQLGAVVVPINYRLTAHDFVYIINHSGARVVCVHEDCLDAVESVRGDLPDVAHFVALEGLRPGWMSYEELLAGSSGEFTPAEIAETDLLALNYTSGTTSRPKGVMITHRNAYMNIVGTLIHVHMTPAERYLWTLPMFHANGWTFVWIITAVGGTHVCLRRVEPQRVFELIGQEGISMLCAAPTVLIGLANAPDEQHALARPGVRVFTAGSPPAAATIAKIEGSLGWNILHVYGMTELSPFVSICEPLPAHADLSPDELATVKARQGVELLTSGELRVVDDEGNPVPRDSETVGEIIVRGNVVMRGYYNDPEATARAIVDGWMHTGDVAVVHPDGYAEIRDRLKDIIISGGENISSVEVEGVLMRHPAVQEVGVVGLPHERWGESPCAFVVLRPGVDATGDELREFAREQLAHFKVPTAWEFVDELPKTATGKIQKYVLRGGRSAIATQ